MGRAAARRSGCKGGKLKTTAEEDGRRANLQVGRDGTGNGEDEQRRGVSTGRWDLNRNIARQASWDPAVLILSTQRTLWGGKRPWLGAGDNEREKTREGCTKRRARGACAFGVCVCVRHGPWLCV